ASGGGRPARVAGAFVVLVAGELAAWLDRRGHYLVTFPAAAGGDDRWVEALVHLVKDGRVRSLEIRRIDGGPAGESPHATALRAAGVAGGDRGLGVRGGGGARGAEQVNGGGR